MMIPSLERPFDESEEPLAAWICEEKSQSVLRANAGAERLLGYSDEEIRGLPLASLLSPDQPPGLLQRAFPPLDDPVLAGRCRLRRKDGTVAAVEIASSPLLHQGRRARILFGIEADADGPARERLLADLFRRSHQRMVLISLARDASSADDEVHSLLGRMIRAAAFALEGYRLSLWTRAPGGPLRRLVSTEDGEPAAAGGDTSARLEIPLPLAGPWSGVLRCSRRGGSPRWATEDGRFLEAVASIAALAIDRRSRPGGVLELRDTLQRALVGTVNDVLGAEGLRLSPPPPEPDARKEQLILEALRTTGGNRTAAAKLLGMSRVTLWKRLKRMGQAETT